MYEEQGEVATAHGLLQQAAEAAVGAGNPEAATELNGAIGELGTSGGPQLATRQAWARVPLPRGVRVTWSPYAMGAVSVALICVIAGGVLSRQDPRLGFVLFFVSALALWNSNVFPDFAVGLALVGVWVLSGIAPAREAVAGFATMDWLFVLAVLGLAVAVARSGLLFRAGLLLVQRSPARLAPQALALMLTGVVLAPLLPEPRGRAALTAPLATAVADAFRFKDREPAAAILGLFAWIGSGPLMFLFLNASPVCLLAWGLMPTEDRDRFDWLTWFLTALPFALIVALGTAISLFVLFKPRMESLPSREGLKLQMAVLGPVSNRERAMIGVLVLTVLGWFLTPASSVHVGTIAVLGLFAAAAIGAFDQQSFREMDWGFLIYYGVALSMRNLSGSLGLAQAVAGLLGMSPGSGAGSGGAPFLLVHPMVFVAIVVIVGFVSRFMLEASQAILLLTLIFFPAATAIGVSPWLVALALLATNNPWVTLKQTPAYQVAYVGTEGRLYDQGQARTAALAYAGVTLGAILLLGPYWQWLGLI
jgi:DASS family divalent anion:Na+ symporter